MGSGECGGHRPPSAPVGAGLRARAGEEEGATRTWGNGGRKAVKTRGAEVVLPPALLSLLSLLSTFLVPKVGPAFSSWDWARGRIHWNTAFSTK